MSIIRIIEHRAGWCSSFEELGNKALQNIEEGFRNSFSRRNGVETDIRDVLGNLVVAHCMPSGKEPTFEKILQIYREYPGAGTLAINIKCDGMQEEMKRLLSKYDVLDYFTFDMSVPDALYYIKNNLNPYIRESEHELDPETASPELYENSAGVWIDQFRHGETSRATYDVLRKHLEKKKKVCIVSPELHPWGRTEARLYIKAWDEYKESFSRLNEEGFPLTDIALCTDLPIQATDFFKG